MTLLDRVILEVGRLHKKPPWPMVGPFYNDDQRATAREVYNLAIDQALEVFTEIAAEEHAKRSTGQRGRRGGA